MESSKTISELKASFIRNQIRILSASLTPSAGWRDYGPIVGEDLGDKAVEDVLQKLNTVLRQHHRAVFSTQAIHHVARQIESLYWNSINPELGSDNSGGLSLEKGMDWTHTESISLLPEQWTGDEASVEEKARYEELHQRLLELDTQRKQQQQRLAQYRQLQLLLDPFKGSQTNIQPNLVTRDGQLSQEIDRMRMLVAKVIGRLRVAKGIDMQPEQQALESADPDKKLTELLDMT